MNFNFSVVTDEAQFAELVHKKADAGSRCANHFGQGLLTDIRADRSSAAFFAELREQKQEPCKSFLAGIEQLVDQIIFNPAVPAQEILYK